jgi:hypothetical protein
MKNGRTSSRTYWLMRESYPHKNSKSIEELEFFFYSFCQRWL